MYIFSISPIKIYSFEQKRLFGGKSKSYYHTIIKGRILYYMLHIRQLLENIKIKFY